MSLYQLALKNIRGNAFRSWVVALCALLVAGFALGTTLILHGAQESLKLVIGRLGADMVVVPEGTTTKVERALLMGETTRVWMPRSNVQEIAAIPGVQVASPQLFLSSLANASCCSASDMFLIAYDPETDFTVTPWLEEELGQGLHLGEAVGGAYVFVPAGEENIKLYGCYVTLKANMEPTGTGLDQSMFLTFETAQDIARLSYSQAEKPLEIPPDSVSTVMIRLEPGVKPSDVTRMIMRRVPGVTPIESLNLFQAYRKQMDGLSLGITFSMGAALVLSVLLIGLVFSMAANERRRELGVLRAIGATRRFVFQSLVTEAGLLALAGGLTGIVLAVMGAFLFRQLIMISLDIPFLLPAPGSLLLEVARGLGLALGSVTVAAIVPAYRISHQDPASAMRE
jgi:putative ABC transport system permease protein